VQWYALFMSHERNLFKLELSKAKPRHLNKIKIPTTRKIIILLDVICLYELSSRPTKCELFITWKWKARKVEADNYLPIVIFVNVRISKLRMQS